MASKKKRNKKSKSGGLKGQIASLGTLLLAVVFMPTTIMLLFAMLPTIVAAVTDKSRRAVKALTVGCMNLAGCTPYLIELWTGGHTAELALDIILDPRTVIVIWLAAGVGYMIDWSMSGIVSTVLVQRSTARLRDIKKRQADLVERWGREVTGEIPLDEFGFPYDMGEGRKDAPSVSKKPQ